MLWTKLSTFKPLTFVSPLRLCAMLCIVHIIYIKFIFWEKNYKNSDLRKIFSIAHTEKSINVVEYLPCCTKYKKKNKE